MLNKIKKRLSGSIKKRLYLLTGIVGVIMLIMVLVFMWAGNTLTMVTAIARFERTHTISRVEAIHFFERYYHYKNRSDLNSFTEKWAITQSYNLVFSNLLEMRTTKSKKEFADIVEKTFVEADRNMSEIVVSRIHLLYWHPLIIRMVNDAKRAHKLGLILDDHVKIILGSDSVAIKSAAFKEIEQIAESLRILEDDFTDQSGALGTEIAFTIKLLSIGMLILSVGITTLVAFLTIRSISTPIGRFIAYSKDVAGGNINAEIPEISGDELLSLSESMAILLNLNQRLKHEVDEKTQMANALQESEERYRSLIMNLDAGIVVHAEDTSIVMNNPRASELLGLSDDQMKGKTAIDPDWKFVNEDNTPLPLEDYPVNRIITSKKPISTQILGIHRPGTKDIVWVTVNGFPMHDSTGSFSEIVISFFDVTERKQAEDELINREKFVDSIIDQSPFATFITDAKGTMQHANPILKKFLNLTDEQIIGKYNVFEDKMIEQMGIMPGVRSVFEEGKTFTFILEWEGYELPHMDLRGANYVWVEGTMFPIYDVDNVLTYMICQWANITERKQAEDELKKTSKELSDIKNLMDAIIEQSPIPIAVARIPDAVLFIVNPACQKNLGLEHELVGKSLINTELEWKTFTRDGNEIPPENLPLARAIRGETVLEEVMRVERKDGSSRWIEVSASPIFDKDGNQVAAQIAFPDITERKQAEEALKKSQSLLADTEKIGKVGGWEVNIDTGKQIWTEEIYRIHEVDLSFEPTVGKGINFYTPTSRRIIERVVQQAIEHSEPFDVELEIITAKGNQRSVHAIGNVDLEKRRIHGFFQDITERQQAAKERETYVAQLEAQRIELERFTYTVSHDLKSPIITIKGFLGMLLKDAQEGNIERLHSDINRINTAATKMGDLLEDLLNLSRIGRIANEPVDVSLDKLAHEVAETLHGPILKRGVRLEIDSGLPVVRGDRIRLHEVLQNLTENAIKFMGDQTTPTIKIGSRIDDGETVCYVRDNGQGIDPVYAEKIFGLFEQLDGHTEGTGIGLALVKRIIEFHGGRVWVESEGPGCGSTFCFSIPKKGES